MKIIQGRNYYIDEYNTFNKYIKEFLSIIKDKKIKSFIPMSGLSWTEHKSFASKVYDTDQFNYLVVDDDIVLKFDYNWFSMIDIEVTNLKDLTASELEVIQTGENFDFDCYGETIIDYELNRFSDEYIIEPSSNKTRPDGGDYFKEIIFHLSNDKKICICPENAESDGYCNIWMENNNLKGIFNGEEHKVWWK